MRAPSEAPLPLDVEFPECPICQGGLENWASVAGYPIQHCQMCGYTLVNPRPNVETLEEYYADGGHGVETRQSVEEVLEGERRYPNSTVDARRIISEVSQLAPGQRLLDVGSGYGFFCHEALERGFQVDAIEISSFERQCTRRVAGVVPEAVTFENFQADPGSYDAILMSQILEHVVDVRHWIAKSHGLLVPDGVLALALPNFDSIVRLLLGPADPLVQPPDHLNYFDAASVRRLLASEGFEVRKTSSISRIPGSAVTRRLPHLPMRIESMVETFVQWVQRPLLWPIDRSGFGMFLNFFATKKGRT